MDYVWKGLFVLCMLSLSSTAMAGGGGGTTYCDKQEDCTTSPTNGCGEYKCNTKTHQCFLRVHKGQTCDDGDACTYGDYCNSVGQCVPRKLVNCHDDTFCTVEYCDPQYGCVLLGANLCDDMNACTQHVCQSSTGFCVLLWETDCEDGFACTLDQCQPETGMCTTQVLPDGAQCVDGAPCMTSGQCKAGQCQGEMMNCSDDSVCTTDFCVPGFGCVHDNDGAACDDGNPCTNDYCWESEECVHFPNADVCDDGDACTQFDTCYQGDCGVPANTAVMPPAQYANGTTPIKIYLSASFLWPWNLSDLVSALQTIQDGFGSDVVELIFLHQIPVQDVESEGYGWQIFSAQASATVACVASTDAGTKFSWDIVVFSFTHDPAGSKEFQEDLTAYVFDTAGSYSIDPEWISSCVDEGIFSEVIEAQNVFAQVNGWIDPTVIVSGPDSYKLLPYVPQLNELILAVEQVSGCDD